MKLQEFFTNMKLNRYNNLFIPKIYSKKNYIGLRKITSNVIDKIWYCLEMKPNQGNEILMRTNMKFTIDHIPFDNNIIYDIKQTFTNLKIGINNTIHTIDCIRSDNIYHNIVAIYKMFRMNSTDQAQLSGFSDGSNKTYIDKNSDILERLDSMYNGMKKVVIDNNSTYIYYHNHDILINIKKGVKQDSIIMVPLKQIGDLYIIYPYSYRNIMLNSYYNDSVRYLFETITMKLNSI
jgi:hypothetical protein